MQNIMSKDERLVVNYIENYGEEPHTTTYGETKRMWFGDEVYDGDCRLKCVSTDYWIDGTGMFVNTVWEDKEGFEYTCLFRDLDENIQYKISSCVLQLHVGILNVFRKVAQEQGWKVEYQERDGNEIMVKLYKNGFSFYSYVYDDTEADEETKMYASADSITAFYEEADDIPEEDVYNLAEAIRHYKE